MTWLHTVISAAILIGAISYLVRLWIQERRRNALRINLVDQPDGSVVVHMEQGDYRLTANMPDRAAATAFIRSEMVRQDVKNTRLK